MIKVVVYKNIVLCNKILDDDFPFKDASEKHLGRFIDKDSAKLSIEKFWQRQDNTLLEEFQSITMR